MNERSNRDDTLLLICVATPAVRTTAHTDLVRLLINRGADVNICASENPPALGLSPLHYACDQLVDHSPDIGHDRRAIEFIVKIGDNGIAWKILSFWKET